jgi:phosphatidylserine decarboxylase
MVHDKLVEFYFVLDQPALRALQSPISPFEPPATLTPLSSWIVDFANAWGSFLDEPESIRHVETFRTNPAFRWNEYMPPPSGYRTFNQFFARHVKPGRRPVASPVDPAVVVSPVDGGFLGQWTIGRDSNITVAESILTKGIRWSIKELLRDSEYADQFAGGVFTHVGLRTFDYHRFHCPVAGKVMEARIIQGQAYLDVKVVDDGCTSADGRACAPRLEAVEGTGYQFRQTRGLIVLESSLGLVACLPVGMAQVASVVLTAEVGSELRKGEELGYFQFGGSDFVMVFQQLCGIQIGQMVGQLFRQGEHFAVGRPVQGSR